MCKKNQSIKPSVYFLFGNVLACFSGLGRIAYLWLSDNGQIIFKEEGSFATEKLCLVCEWENCNVVEADIEIFLSHVVNTHLTNLTLVLANFLPYSFFKCRWINNVPLN
ncbi:hypothetical protein TNCT_718231 [Trichonephila clavata]|uniref:Uncharacterized protein n=1 Tax=Trichonephila clavata TaxID=2740835 RepID=A0A8X6G5H0_TRICU|nr:hypothetical protein TNCT_718231 [Trichonephila clavata]